MEQSSQNNQAQFDRICQKMKRLLVKKQNLIQAIPQEVIPNVFLSNYAFAMNKNFLTLNNIGLVVTCVKIQEKERVKGISYKQILIKDKPQQKISQHFDQVYLIITNFLAKTPGHKCLINCFSGKSRSPTLVISYLIKNRSISFQQAYQIVKKGYSKSQPNSGFIAQLKQYEKKLKAEERKQQRKQTMSPTQTKLNKQEVEQEKDEKEKGEQTKIEQKQCIEQVEQRKETERKQENRSKSPIEADLTNEINVNQKDQNQKFQILESQKVQEKIQSQNSAEQYVVAPTDTANQSIVQNLEQKIVTNLAENLSQQEISEQRQKVEQNFQPIQSQTKPDGQAEEPRQKTKIEEQKQQKKQQVVQKQENKSENEQKNEVAASSEPRKKKKKNKKKKVEN